MLARIATTFTSGPKRKGSQGIVTVLGAQDSVCPPAQLELTMDRVARLRVIGGAE